MISNPTLTLFLVPITTSTDSEQSQPLAGAMRQGPSFAPPLVLSPVSKARHCRFVGHCGLHNRTSADKISAYPKPFLYIVFIYLFCLGQRGFTRVSAQQKTRRAGGLGVIPQRLLIVPVNR